MATEASGVATLVTAVAMIAELQRELPPTPASVAMLVRAAEGSFKHKQRYFGGAGEDLAGGFRPQWMKAPRLGPSIAGKTQEEKAKNAAADRAARGSDDAIGYTSYAAFTSHVLDWCVKMVLLKQMEIIDVVNYLGILAYVAQEYGGTKTAFWYEHLTRESLTKAAVWQKDDAAKAVGKLDVDRVRNAKLRAEQPGRAAIDRRPTQEQERATKQARARKGKGKGSGNGNGTDSGNGNGKKSGGQDKHGGGQDKQNKKGGDQGSAGAGQKWSGRDRW